MPSSDDLEVDSIPLDQIERAKHEFGLNEKEARALLMIRQGLPLKDFTRVLTEELWVREVIKDLEIGKCKYCSRTAGPARTKALQLMGEWMGILGSKSKKKMNRTVSFE